MTREHLRRSAHLPGLASLVCLLLFLSVASGVATSCLRVGPFRRPLVSPRFEVAAFAMEEGERGLRGSLSSLKANTAAVDMVLDYAGLVLDDGTLDRELGSRAIRDLARINGKRVVLLASNARPGEPGNTAMFNTARSRARTVSNLVDLVIKGGYDGLHLCFERMPIRAKALYSAFVRDLARALRPRRKTLGVSVFPVVDLPSGTWGACDYSVIGKEADYVVFCAYDRHHLGTVAGPVAPLPWVEASLKKALMEIDPSKILLGVGVYAYDWPSTPGAGAPEYLSTRDALQLAAAHGAKVSVDSASQQATFAYNRGVQKRIVWLQDAFNMRSKTDLAGKYGLRGIAVWRLGLEDSLTFSVISSMKLK